MGPASTSGAVVLEMNYPIKCHICMGGAVSVDDVGVTAFSWSAVFFISSVCFFWWLTKPEREVNRLLQSSKVQMYSWISPTCHETQSTKTRMTASMNAE